MIMSQRQWLCSRGEFMDNLWSRMNEEVPIYMHDIIEKYSMSSIKLSSAKTALICKNYCLIISIDRFEATISYLYKKMMSILFYNVITTLPQNIMHMIEKD